MLPSSSETALLRVVRCDKLEEFGLEGLELLLDGLDLHDSLMCFLSPFLGAACLLFEILVPFELSA